MNIEQIEAFLYVSLTKSFKKAGELLYISQPTVSARIKTLENEIGHQLFVRNGKQITLTKEGEAFIPYAKKGVEFLQDGLLAIDDTKGKTKGNISVSIVLTMTNYIFPSLIRDFNQSFPEVKLTVHTGHSHNVLNMVLNHDVSLGISRSVDHPKIKTIHLLDDEMVLVIYRDHPFFSRNSILLEEVVNEPLILFNRGSLDWALINNAFGHLNRKPNVVLEADNIEFVKQMIMEKMGIGILPRTSIERELEFNNLCVVKIKDLPQLSRPFQLIYLKETKVEGILKVFIDFVRERMTL
ncbi:LysR family transcriptional regulator [Ammoniphilus sp. CFH 90114]|uniref:LysR family transcriptional regulator n=1 Tax=Ammoniphilus sp. CFH 90114 TaxID=2493665 RepID=UPI00100E27B2|nr:LysR family transcriptional regulator [Ammoniphilus sp. CFH 90114]RXT07881.1 LysR family transcriptional regulator [Ammoniphilus sp. CFH 90114]